MLWGYKTNFAQLPFSKLCKENREKPNTLNPTMLYILELVEEEEGEDSQMRTSDEELEEDVFRTRKADLISGDGKLFSQVYI